MDAAAYKALVPMLGKFVQIVWFDPNQDWLYYRLLKISRGDGTIFVRGMDLPNSFGWNKRDAFWANYADVLMINPVMLEI